jgi:hypothetical protein
MSLRLVRARLTLCGERSMANYLQLLKLLFEVCNPVESSNAKESGYG